MDFDRRIAPGYQTARALSDDTATVWRRRLSPFFHSGQTILDLGAGTGRFSGRLADWSGAAVIVAIEPSRGMRAIAAQQNPHPRVAYAGGIAESLPLRNGSCDIAWLSQVFHHLRSHRRAAEELRRVIRPGGLVILRGTFGDRLHGFPTLFRFFPGARRLAEDFPTVPQVVEAMHAGGIALELVEPVSQHTCCGLRALAERTRLRADTTLALLSDDEFRQGQAALERAACEEGDPAPIVETLDFIVLRRL